MKKIETFQHNGSGWALREVFDVNLRAITHDQTRASSYLQLLEKLHKSHSILNIHNEDDDKCALWCILAHLFSKHYNNDRNHREDYSKAYKGHEHEIVTKDVEFPLKISDIGKLERWNNLAINVFSLEKFANLIPIRISDEKVSDNHVIDLLYIVNGDNSHYCLITNIGGLLRSQCSHAANAEFSCHRCLHFSRREESYKNHVERCSRHKPQKTIYPKRNDKKGRDKLRFTNVDIRSHYLFTLWRISNAFWKTLILVFQIIISRAL